MGKQEINNKQERNFLTEITRKDGSEAIVDDYRNAVPDLSFRVLAIDWDAIYEITDSLQDESKTKGKKNGNNY